MFPRLPCPRPRHQTGLEELENNYPGRHCETIISSSTILEKTTSIKLPLARFLADPVRLLIPDWFSCELLNLQSRSALLGILDYIIDLQEKIVIYQEQS